MLTLLLDSYFLVFNDLSFASALHLQFNIRSA